LIAHYFLPGLFASLSTTASVAACVGDWDGIWFIVAAGDCAPGPGDEVVVVAPGFNSLTTDSMLAFRWSIVALSSGIAYSSIRLWPGSTAGAVSFWLQIVVSRALFLVVRTVRPRRFKNSFCALRVTAVSFKYSPTSFLMSALIFIEAIPAHSSALLRASRLWRV